MGYRNLVVSSVSRAFNAVGDLAETVTLTLKTATSFDFATADANISVATTKTVKGIFVQTKKPASSINEAKSRGTRQDQMLIQAKDLDNPDLYDKLTRADGSVWSIVQPSKSDGFLITLDLARE